MTWTESILAQHIVNGLVLGCIYALIALGYTLIFGVMRLIFFAQGEICMVGAFGALAVVRWFSPAPWLALPVALAGAAMVSVTVGVLSERAAIRPLRSAPRTKQLIASLGISLILQNAVLVWVSSENLTFPALLPHRTWLVGPIALTPLVLFILTVSVSAMLILHWVLRSTRIGLHLRAVAESAETAELDGIKVGRTFAITFFVGSLLAAVAGVMLGSYDGVAKYNMGFLPGIKGFTAAILGGFGHPGGAMLGGLFLGLAENLAAGYVSSTYKDLLAFVVLVLVLVIRPGGLTGKGRQP